MSNFTCPEYRSPDLTEYRMSADYPIRCPKCGAGSNCITSSWTRGKIELKCICGWISERFIDEKRKIARREHTAPPVVAVPQPPAAPTTTIKRCRKCRKTFEIPYNARGLYCEVCRKDKGLPIRTYDQPEAAQ